MRARIGSALLCLGLTAAASAADRDAQARSQTLRNPQLYYLDHSDVSRPLREMPVLQADPRDEGDRQHPVKLIRPVREVPKGWVDPLESASRAAAPAPAVSTTAGLSFDGVGVGLGTFTPNGAPPDTVGAAGATQYVQWVNTSFAVFNKSTGALVYGPAGGNTLFQGFGGPCETTNSGDPIVMYDKAAGRWVMTQFSINQAASQFYQCVAVSTTSDATGTYRRFAYSFTGFNDYPKGGVWPDGYYISFNIFNAAGTAFLGAQACALDRNQMITASGTPRPIQCFQLSSTFGGLLPSDLDGSTAPPAGAPNYFVAFDDVNNNGLNLWRFHVDWTTPANSTFTGPTKINGATFSPACGGGTCVPQPSTTQQLDSLADRLMYRLAYRNFGTHESLVVNHSVTVGSTASGVRWYEVRSPNGTPTIFQSGTFSPDATSRWMGSIAQDRQGNMLMGYSVSSSSVRPGIRYTGRLVTDAAGTMQTENTLTTGVGSQTGGLSRWGDYSAMTIDPADDCTFWFTTEYLKSTGSYNWSTRIGSFRFPGCGGTATPDFSISCTPSSVSANQGGNATSTCTVSSLNGFASAVSLDCTGQPAGVTCAYAPASVTPPANGSTSSTLTVSVGASVAAGTYNFSARGTNGTTTRTAAIALTVNPPAGSNQVLSFSSAPNVAIPDNNTTGVTNTINVSNSLTITSVSVRVGITHTYQGDLEVALIGPDNTTVLLHNRTGAGTDNINTTYNITTRSNQALTAFNTKNTSGAWRLRVRDLASADTGTLNSWQVTFNGYYTAAPNLAIPDNNTTGVTSTINVPATGTIASLRVRVGITHTYKGDLEVALIGPDNTTVLLHNRTGGSTDNVNTVYPDLTAPAQALTAFNGKAINGAWRLRVRDLASTDTGTLNSWEIDFRTN